MTSAPDRRTVILVSCVAGKLDKAAPARDLYTSRWFRHARRYAEESITWEKATSWYILSARWGLVAPDTVIEPYDLIVKGVLPVPDFSVMVDVGYEKSATWRYAHSVLIPQLASVGVNLEIVPKSDYATVDLWSGADGKTLVLPVFTDKSGTVGKMPNFCSYEWKRRVIERHMRQVHRLSAWVSWLGMSTDEMRRVRVRGSDHGDLNDYPLIFGPRPMNRARCVAFVTDELGWPLPPKSACNHCPNQSDEQWKEMRDNEPGDFAAAVQMEREFRSVDQNAWLHPSCVPLDEVDFDALCAVNAARPAGEREGCDSGHCFV